MDSLSLRERQKEKRRTRIYNVAIDLFKHNGLSGHHRHRYRQSLERFARNVF